ncbi:MAG: KTSC domain-containing protein [Ignavibacteriaceae bacterium]|nr:KTSC domain-containing protein [Ignavibacteriaceae bacterium]
MDIEKIFVSSSNVEALGYDDNTQTLRVWFLNGSIYDYRGVGKMEFEGLLNAPSIGSYLHKNIKGQYSYEKVG